MKRCKLIVAIISICIFMQPLRVNAMDIDNNSLENDMDITATVEDDMAIYSVIIPASVSMGRVSKVTDNVKDYEITVKTKNKNGKITVLAPSVGELTNEDNVLKFENDFGEQTFLADENIDEKILKGKIYISQEDVMNVPVGTYRGSTTFTIKYEENEIKNDNAENINQGSMSNGASLNGGSTLNGGATLGNGNVLGSLLTNNKLSSNLTNLSNSMLGVKTYDDKNILLWIAITSISGLIAISIMLEMRFDRKKTIKKGNLRDDVKRNR